MTAIRRHRDPRLDARTEPVPGSAAEELARQYGYGLWRQFNLAVNARADARSWGYVERVAAEYLWQVWERHLGIERPSETSIARLMALNGALYAALREALKPARFLSFEMAIDRLETDTASWESVIGPLAAAYWRHAAVLWLAMTHLTLAGASADQVHGGVVRLMGLLAGEPEQASPQVKSRPNVRAMARNSADAMAPVMAAAGAAGRKAGLGLKQAATIAAPIARDLARRGYQSGKTHWQAWHVRQKAKRVARSEQLAREREAAAAKHAAKLEADRLRQVQAHAGDGDAGDHQPLRLKGSALRSSVVGTWLMLVILSWVALLWGAILSIPFGVGIALIASFMGGMVAVPLWGTIFGFLGMSGARSSTLHAMGYEPLDPHHVLAGACAGYCEILDIPMPRLGTIKPFNAFAMGLDHRNATVAIGRPLIEQMSTDEAKAVLAHELGHVVSGDMRKMMLMRTFQNATVWFMLGQGLKQFARWIICWVAELAILAFSRHREYWADAVGAALAGKEAMIGALLKLDGAPSLSPAERTHARFMVRGRPFSTHPSIQQRIAALEKGTYLKRLPVRSPS